MGKYVILTWLFLYTRGSVKHPTQVRMTRVIMLNLKQKHILLFSTIMSLPGADVCEAPETEDELEGVEDAFKKEESPELHDGGV